MHVLVVLLLDLVEDSRELASVVVLQLKNLFGGKSEVLLRSLLKYLGYVMLGHVVHDGPGGDGLRSLCERVHLVAQDRRRPVLLARELGLRSH